MRNRFNIYIMFFASCVVLLSCNGNGRDDNASNHKDIEHSHTQESVHLTSVQLDALSIQIDTIPLRSIASYVEANGKLEVPPQNEATVTAIIGANVVSIKVIEGDKVRKGEPLAYLSHPDLIKMQSDYINEYNQLQYLGQEYQRQQKLYEEKVGSGKQFQKTKADYLSLKGIVTGLEAQLKQFGLNLTRIRSNNLYEQVPVHSPIDGYVRLVEVKTGQYVSPQSEMFEIVNNDHIHADLMVFEKDMHKVKVGQKVNLFIESLDNQTLQANIYAVGKAFEDDPKAVHIHADIEEKSGLLIPGTYVRGRIITDDNYGYALPEDAVVKENNRYYIFTADVELHDDDTSWIFYPLEVTTGSRDNGWVEIKPLKAITQTTKVAFGSAYYLMAEMKKGEAEHSH
ncbi:MAG: efflux RND transporter periplasmic adaptor subunit [Chitinophagales bacterium]|nr:efflux RND transporter periplasmic adaptor subunit [Bacteroidota bacterium]MCB9064690.1 efflux RND transporter periplasmic adaptor subunit [Chitinophagales bacterium]